MYDQPPFVPPKGSSVVHDAVRAATGMLIELGCGGGLNSLFKSVLHLSYRERPGALASQLELTRAVCGAAVVATAVTVSPW